MLLRSVLWVASAALLILFSMGSFFAQLTTVTQYAVRHDGPSSHSLADQLQHSLPSTALRLHTFFLQRPQPSLSSQQLMLRQAALNSTNRQVKHFPGPQPPPQGSAEYSFIPFPARFHLSRSEALRCKRCGYVVYYEMTPTEEEVDCPSKVRRAIRHLLVVVQSWRASGSKYPMYVASQGSLPASLLEALKALGAQWLPMNSAESRLMEQVESDWDASFNKLALFGQTEFQRLVMVDYDTIFLKHMDEVS